MDHAPSPSEPAAAGVTVDWYAPGDAPAWDAFVATTPTGNFLHTRKFLGYHGTRYEDRSLVFRDARDAICGVMPAALSPGDPTTVVSHPGATYGGLLLTDRHQGLDAFATLRAARAFLSAAGL